MEPLDVRRNAVDRLMCLAGKLESVRAQPIGIERLWCRAGSNLLHDFCSQPPHTAQESMHASHAVVRPVGVFIGRTEEQDVAAGGVGAVAVNVPGGADD